MGLITDEFIRDMITKGEVTRQEVRHWVEMGWYKSGKTEYFIDCDEFGGKTMSEEAQKGFLKAIIRTITIETKSRKREYRIWKKRLKNG